MAGRADRPVTGIREGQMTRVRALSGRSEPPHPVRAALQTGGYVGKSVIYPCQAVPGSAQCEARRRDGALPLNPGSDHFLE